MNDSLTPQQQEAINQLHNKLMEAIKDIELKNMRLRIIELAVNGRFDDIARMLRQ